MELVSADSVPDDFRCPISLELMSDPVILTSGHTFDRRSIERWLDSGNLTCPISQLPLPPRPPLIPNYALRRLISQFTPSQNPILHPGPASSLDPNSLAFPSDAATLASLLKLAQKDAAFRRKIADSSAPAVLLRHVAARDSPDLRDLALRVLLQLSLDGDDARVGLAADGAVSAAVAAVDAGEGAALAATLLTSLAVADVNKCTIGAHPRAVLALAALLRSPAARDRREAATALYELCKFPENRRRAVRAGAVPDLVWLIKTGSERAVEVLGLIGKCKEGREEMGRVDGLVRVLGKVLRDGSSERGVMNSLSVLNLMCSESEIMGLEAKKEGILEVCFDLAAEDEGKIGKNALGLARTLQKVRFCGVV